MTRSLGSTELCLSSNNSVPFNYMISRPTWAPWVFPVAEVLWAVVTFCESQAKNAGQLYAIRFIEGTIESGSFVGTQYILGSWFTAEELYKRSGTWYIASGLGSMFSGYLQSAAYTGLNGKGGLAGWRWVWHPAACNAQIELLIWRSTVVHCRWHHHFTFGHCRVLAFP